MSERKPIQRKSVKASEAVTPSLGVCFTALNEVALIPAAIAQFYPYVDDIAVVVDDRTTDKTAEWCERMGARFITRPFNNSWVRAKNASIEMLDTDWIYVADCDELLEPPLLTILPLLTSELGQIHLINAGIIAPCENLYDCYGIPRRNFIDGEFQLEYPDYQYRLFANHVSYDPNGPQVHQEVTNFTQRTEVDYQRDSLEKPSRFNMLHFKSRSQHGQQA